MLSSLQANGGFRLEQDLWNAVRSRIANLVQEALARQQPQNFDARLAGSVARKKAEAKTREAAAWPEQLPRRPA